MDCKFIITFNEKIMNDLGWYALRMSSRKFLIKYLQQVNMVKCDYMRRINLLVIPEYKKNILLYLTA